MARDERLATSVTEAFKRRFRAEAGRRDMDMSEMLRQAAEEWMEEHEGEELEGNSRRPATTTPARAD